MTGGPRGGELRANIEQRAKRFSDAVEPVVDDWKLEARLDRQIQLLTVLPDFEPGANENATPVRKQLIGSLSRKLASKGSGAMGRLAACGDASSASTNGAAQSQRLLGQWRTERVLRRRQSRPHHLSAATTCRDSRGEVKS